MKTDEIIEKTIEKNGKNIQCVVAMEEMSELQKEMSKAIRGKDNRENIIEEIADVEIMIKQIMRMFEITPHEVNDQVKKKIKRMEERLNG